MKKKTYFFIIFATLILMSAGFAMVATDIKIKGETKFKGQNFNVYFDNLINVSSYESLELDTNNKTKVNLSLNINPNETYEFKVDANNRGSLNATIKSISLDLNDLDDSLTYEVLNLDGTEVSIGQYLYMSSTDTYIAKIKYDGTDVGSINLNTSFIVDYGIGKNKIPDKVSLLGEIYDKSNGNTVVQNGKIVIDDEEVLMTDYEYALKGLSIGNHTITVKDENDLELATGNINVTTGLFERINEENVVIKTSYGENLYIYLENGNVEYGFNMPQYNVSFVADGDVLSENNKLVTRYNSDYVRITDTDGISSMSCTNGQNITLDLDNAKININHITSDSVCSIETEDFVDTCEYESGYSWTFGYNGVTGADGETQPFTVPCSGEYKLEAWGAQGGTVYVTDDTHGGYGGYATGQFNLIENNTLYIAVGGAGGECGSTGGYNGGGTVSKSCSNYITTSGGGATHIALVDDTLQSIGYDSFVNNRLGLIVAGGGGGSYRNKNQDTNASGGSGGGYIGGHGFWGSSSTGGGTQTNGYKFGKGYENSYINTASGGGGGLYGGSKNSSDGATAGGSGYIRLFAKNSIMYCYNCEENDGSGNSEYKTVSTTGDSVLKDTANCSLGYSSDAISKCPKVGNGYAKITYIGPNRSNKKLRVITGDGTQVGDELAIGNEHFYLLSNTGNEIKMISKYNLLVGNTCDSAGKNCVPVENPTGIQDESAMAYNGTANPRVGVVTYSDSNYWGTVSIFTYVYNKNSSIYQYLENYKAYLENSKVNIIGVKLISSYELNELGCIMGQTTCRNSLDFLKNTSFWTGAAYDKNSMYAVNNTGGVFKVGNTNDNNYGIRPVVIVPSSALN